MKVRSSLTLLLAATVSLARPFPGFGADAGAAARGLVGRVLPERARQFTVETIPPDEGHDVFELQSGGGKIILRGNNAVAIASALNRYLQDYCHCDISWNCGAQLHLPTPLPSVPGKVRVTSPYRYRYAYNFCTHGYTMAWWDWPQWRRELDFLALKGVNLALIIEGQESVWIQTLKDFGYSNHDVRAWLVMPSHQPCSLRLRIRSMPRRIGCSARTVLCGRSVSRRRQHRGHRHSRRRTGDPSGHERRDLGAAVLAGQSAPGHDRCAG